MTTADLASPAVADLLAQASRGLLPTEDELDELGLPPAGRRRVADAAAVAVAVCLGGKSTTADSHRPVPRTERQRMELHAI